MGRALCCSLHNVVEGGVKRFRVFATARKLDTLSDLRADGIDVLQMDVTSSKVRLGLWVWVDSSLPSRCRIIAIRVTGLGVEGFRV